MKQETHSTQLDNIPHDLSPTTEELERELPLVHDGQVPLGELLSRVTQAIYAELVEYAETLPNQSDMNRKRYLADWVVKTKKQIVKLYAIAKWSRDADTVQKCMNITAFLMTQNQQFQDAISLINYGRDSLDSARLRNHDLLTSLDVLTKGSYLRLPTCIMNSTVSPTPLSDNEISRTLSNIEDAIQYRLRASEVVPVEMTNYRIADGRVFFTVPKLFETSVCLNGVECEDGWFFVHVEFLIKIGGDLTGLQEFPRVPTGMIKRHITDEADARLGFYILNVEESVLPTVSEHQLRPKLPNGVVDAPLVRLYNFLQMMSLSYQLEILWYQAERLRSLGWADYLRVQMSDDRKSMTVTYWIRGPLPSSAPGRQQPKLSLFGGTLTISIVETHSPPLCGGGPERTPKARVIDRLRQKSKLGNSKPSDEVEGLKFSIHWELAKFAFGVSINAEETSFPEGFLNIDPDNLDFEGLLLLVLERHTEIILSAFKRQLQSPGEIFSPLDVVTIVQEGRTHALRINLCSDEVVLISIDSRTGKLALKDTGDLAAAGRAPKFGNLSNRLSGDPTMLTTAMTALRISIILNMAEHKASYLGLQCYKNRNFGKEELMKLGHARLFIQLAAFPNHYLVLVVTDTCFKYALITATVLPDTGFAGMTMGDIAWLNSDRIRGEDIITMTHPDRSDPRIGFKQSRNNTDNDRQLLSSHSTSSIGFNLETQVLRGLYNYCCARVAYMNVERQFKLRGIPFTYVNPTSGTNINTDLCHIQSSLARSVPALCVESKHILSGAPAAEAAMPNIRVIPLNWWSEEKAQVVTCVKLKYVQQPMGKKTSGTSAVIRPSKRIIYDTTEAIVSFLSENVNTCVDEFLEEWARVSKMVVIAREVAQMAKEKEWHGVQLVSFDLQTVEFVYATDYAVSISCEDQLSPTGGNFDLRFSRRRLQDSARMDEHDSYNPHDDAEPFFRNLLRHGHGRLAPSLHRLVSLLRYTLPIVAELEEIKTASQLVGRNVDTFVKAAGWYRLLYGDLCHALDFRLMTKKRVAIVDGSHSIFTANASNSQGAGLGLQPIPNFVKIISDVTTNLISTGQVGTGAVAMIDVGVVCATGCVQVLGRAIHSKISEQLRKG
ncbi:mediator complex subunit MED14-domain-containing protein [Cyathus striatus]|nr:mediator complex subunit MED14-domain-containing protein [Cyathus striatus]